MSTYYNEIDPFAAAWLRNLIAAGLIAPGDVDERSIADVSPDDLRGYRRCHFFAGIGGWSYALRLAGVPDDRPVWTGSCPCQPFSAAGAGKAADDERHLWPVWFPLIAECRPAIVFGEQVEAAIGWGWLDAVFADLEAEGYACGATVLPACGVGAPHIRQRIWFVADAECRRLHEQCRPSGIEERAREWRHQSDHGSNLGMAHPDGRHPSAEGLQRGWEQRQQPEDGQALLLADAASDGRRQSPDHAEHPTSRAWGSGDSHDDRIFGEGRGMESSLAYPERSGWAEGRTIAGNGLAAGSGGNGSVDGAASARCSSERRGQPAEPERRDGLSGMGRAQRPWSDAVWLPCTDGKARPVEPGTFPLAHGVSGRVGRLRAYGNAIVPQVAAEFILACRP